MARRSKKAATELNITGTPTFFINGTKIEGNTWPLVKTALQNAGAR